MPIKLKGVLARYGLRQSEVCKAVCLKGGRPISSSALSMLINWGTWPKLTLPDEIREQVTALLRTHKVSEAEIASAFDMDDADTYRGAHPVGVHLGQVHTRRHPEPDIEPMEVQMLSPAAKRHFGIFRDPFQDDVNGPEDVFLAEDQRYIREAMFQTAKHGGFLAVIGESGAGKSVLRRDLIDRIARDSHAITVIFPRTLDKSKLTAGAICEAIVQDLQPNTRMRQRVEGQARQVEEALRASAQAGNAHVLLIEEAHDLTVQTLKYLKRFWELEDGFRKLLSIVLVGQPELKMLLDERTNYEAREVIRRCEIAELRPLDAHLGDYLQLKFKRVGIDFGKTFTDDALDAIRIRLTRSRAGGREVLSQLYPLAVNNLVTKAFNKAAELGVPVVSGDLVKEL